MSVFYCIYSLFNLSISTLEIFRCDTDNRMPCVGIGSGPLPLDYIESGNPFHRQNFFLKYCD